jgi:hypothetical protein
MGARTTSNERIAVLEQKVTHVETELPADVGQGRRHARRAHAGEGRALGGRRGGGPGRLRHRNSQWIISKA